MLTIWHTSGWEAGMGKRKKAQKSQRMVHKLSLKNSVDTIKSIDTSYDGPRGVVDIDD